MVLGVGGTGREVAAVRRGCWLPATRWLLIPEGRRCHSSATPDARHRAALDDAVRSRRRRRHRLAALRRARRERAAYPLGIATTARRVCTDRAVHTRRSTSWRISGGQAARRHRASQDRGRRGAPERAHDADLDVASTPGSRRATRFLIEPGPVGRRPRCRRRPRPGIRPIVLLGLGELPRKPRRCQRPL